jgi:very-short-patch-repair endonuclease
MILAGLPSPELQAWVQGADGRPYRADFYWRERRVIGEADGLVEYGSIDDVRAEKRREDALRQAGFALVRWTSEELRRTPDRVLGRLRYALRP